MENQIPTPVTGTNKSLIPASIIFAGIIIAGAVIYSTGERQIVQNNQPAKLVAPTVDDDVILGEADAPVTIIEFGDYECPYCEVFYKETEEQIRRKYIETGKVKMVYRDFPLDKHPSAMPAALAAQCAGDQGKYWAYHDALFDRQAQLATMDYTALAKELGLNEKTFKSCLDSRKYENEVKKDYQDGVRAGVKGTPAFFINGIFIEGAYPYEDFEKVIEAALAKTELNFIN